MLGAEGDGDAAGDVVLVGVLAHGVYPGAGEGLQAVELEPLALDGVLDPRLLQVVENDLDEVAGASRGSVQCRFGCGAVATGVGRNDAVRGETFDGERTSHPDTLGVLVGLVVEHLGVGVASDCGVDLGTTHTFPDVGVIGDGP